MSYLPIFGICRLFSTFKRRKSKMSTEQFRIASFQEESASIWEQITFWWFLNSLLTYSIFVMGLFFSFILSKFISVHMLYNVSIENSSFFHFRKLSLSLSFVVFICFSLFSESFLFRVSATYSLLLFSFSLIIRCLFFCHIHWHGLFLRHCISKISRHITCEKRHKIENPYIASPKLNMFKL